MIEQPFLAKLVEMKYNESHLRERVLHVFVGRHEGQEKLSVATRKKKESPRHGKHLIPVEQRSNGWYFTEGQDHYDKNERRRRQNKDRHCHDSKQSSPR